MYSQRVATQSGSWEILLAAHRSYASMYHSPDSAALALQDDTALVRSIALGVTQDFAGYTTLGTTISAVMPPSSDLSYPLEASVPDMGVAECKVPNTAMQLSSHQPQCVVDANYPYHILSANSLWLDFCGFEENEVVGMTLDIL